MTAYEFGLSYILVGILVCLVFVAISDWSLSNSTIFIYDRFELGDRKKFCMADLISVTVAVENRNDDLFAVGGIALEKEEMVGALCKYFGIRGRDGLTADELLYALHVADKEGEIFVRGGLLTRAFHSDVLAARKVYDSWVAGGGVKLASGPGRFLKANKISLLGGVASSGSSAVALLSKSERLEFLSALDVFSNENAKVLLGVLNGGLKVMAF
jgi:hypothetical protein